MPFMTGVAPARRTLDYLKKGKLFFSPEIKVMTLNYNIDQKASSGAYEFQFWHFPQIKYKNKELQLLKFKNMTPTPCIQLLFLGGQKQVIDVYGRSREDIHDHLLNTYCIPEEKLEDRVNPALFGPGCNYNCICQVPGQVPCPGFTKLPNAMRGKYKFGDAAEDS